MAERPWHQRLQGQQSVALLVGIDLQLHVYLRQHLRRVEYWQEENGRKDLRWSYLQRYSAELMATAIVNSVVES
jgi:hypothetical protein